VKQQEEVDEPPVVVVHEHVLEGSRDAVEVAFAARLQGALELLVDRVGTAAVLDLGPDQALQVAAQLQGTVREQDRKAPGHHPLLVAAEDRKRRRQRGREGGEELAPSPLDLLGSQVLRVLEVFLEDVRERVQRFVVPHHPSIVSGGPSGPAGLIGRRKGGIICTHAVRRSGSRDQGKSVLPRHVP
jgi:hypothetical protein